MEEVKSDQDSLAVDSASEPLPLPPNASEIKNGHSIAITKNVSNIVFVKPDAGKKRASDCMHHSFFNIQYIYSFYFFLFLSFVLYNYGSIYAIPTSINTN